MEKRAKGFYWVMLTHRWVIAEWTGKFWLTTGTHIEWNDRHFDKIQDQKLSKKPFFLT